MNQISQLPLHIFILAGVLLTLVSLFIGKFFIPALRLRRRLRISIQALIELKSRSGDSVLDLEQISKLVVSDKKMLHLWEEYKDSLHPQKKADASGQEKVSRWRSTVPVEMFFSTQTLVDVPLKTEFFKHLPGILTGIGILGTFFGLLEGLKSFDISDNPQIVRDSLSMLLHGVNLAFLISASAIFLAMLATLVEKWLIADCYKQVEELCHLIDSMFDAGAGEEYLSRLVNASESSATQTAQLKDALVSDLKEILSDLTKQHIEAISANTRIQVEATSQSGLDVSKAISDSLKDPLDKIASAVNRTTDSQNEAVNKVLTDVLASFTAKIQDLFGGQMVGLNELMQQTMVSMQAAIGRFDQLAANLDSAGRGAADAMAERLNQAIEALEARQQTLNTQMGEFISGIRDLVSRSQSETSDQLQMTIQTLGEQMTGLVAQLETQARQASSAHQDQQRQITDHATGVVSGLSGQVEVLVGQANDTAKSMQASVAAMKEVTSDAIKRMNSGADTLYMAADEFAKAGKGITTVMQQTSVVSDKLVTTAGALTSAVTGVQKIFDDYQKARDSVALMVVELQKAVENAKREASVTQELVDSLKAAAAQVNTVQGQVESYFKEVSQALVNVHTEFAANIERTLGKGNAEFMKHLTDATAYLGSAVKNIGDLVDNLPSVGSA